MTRQRIHKKSENIQEKSDGQQFLPPFILGFSVALLLVLIPTISGYFWVCGDVDLGVEKGCSCPRLIRRTKHVVTNKSWLQRLGAKAQEVEHEFLIIKDEPVESVCRLLADVWSQVMTKRTDCHETTCKPEIVSDDALESIIPTTLSHDHFKTASTSEFLELDNDQKNLVIALGERVEATVENWRFRASKVSWGGTGPPWFALKNPHGAAALENIDGGLLFYSYLRIMKWPKQLFAHFPFKLCAKGCDAEMALDHTLEFREKFQPWVVSPSTIQENSNGCVFHHGFSPPYHENERGAHSLV